MKTPYRFVHRKGRNIQVSFADIPGRWFSTGTEDMAKAVLWAEKKLHGRGAARDEDITLSEFAKGFFTKEDPHGYRHRLERRGTFYQEAYFTSHQARLDNYILKAHGAYLIKAIKETMIEDFILDIPKLSNDSRNKILTCYRIVLKEAVREGYIEDNPAQRVMEMPPNNKGREAFTPQEIALLFPPDDEALIRQWNGIGGTEGLKYAVYFLIQKDTGWRPGEVSALSKPNYFPEYHGIYTTCDVHWQTHTIQNRIKTTHRGQKYKTGFLTEQTERLLQQLIACTKGDYLFLCNKKHQRDRTADFFLYPDLCNKKLKEVCGRVGVILNGRTQYSFRHTFNTNALGNLPETARLLLMGHTANRQEYNHLTPEMALKRILSIEGTAQALGIDAAKVDVE